MVARFLFFQLWSYDRLFRQSSSSSPLLLQWYIAILLVSSSVEIKTRGAVQHISHSFAEEMEEEHLSRCFIHPHPPVRRAFSRWFDSSISISFQFISRFDFHFFACLTKCVQWLGESGQLVDCLIIFFIVSYLHMLRNSSFLSFFAVTSLLIYSLLQHIFRSAYKIVFKRAIHHRTMLISSRLDHLGGVWNLEQFAATIAGTHERFSSAVVQEFTNYYQIDIMVNTFWRLLISLGKPYLFQVLRGDGPRWC